MANMTTHTDQNNYKKNYRQKLTFDSEHMSETELKQWTNIRKVEKAFDEYKAKHNIKKHNLDQSIWAWFSLFNVDAKKITKTQMVLFFLNWLVSVYSSKKWWFINYKIVAYICDCSYQLVSFVIKKLEINRYVNHWTAKYAYYLNYKHMNNYYKVVHSKKTQEVRMTYIFDQNGQAMEVPVLTFRHSKPYHETSLGQDTKYVLIKLVDFYTPEILKQLCRKYAFIDFKEDEKQKAKQNQQARQQKSDPPDDQPSSQDIWEEIKNRF